MDYLAKRLDSLDFQERTKFQAMAVKLGTFDMTDFLNLTFCCQQATVITDFSDLSKVGLQHFLTVNGGASQDELEQVNFHSVAQNLIFSEAGLVTPFGVVYDNGMQMEQIYDGQHFPEYLYDNSLMTLEIRGQQESNPAASTWLYLPMSERQIERALQRAGIQNADVAYEIKENVLTSRTADIVESSNNSIAALNKMCSVVSILDDIDRRKLDAVVYFAKPESVSEITRLAENLDLFDFVPNIRTSEEYGRYMIQESGRYNYDENLAQVYDYEKYGQQRVKQEFGMFTEQGYIAYHGTLSRDELLAEDPPEQGFQMGGMA
jgi:hypothetical protein